MPPLTSSVASGVAWAYPLGRLLKNPFQRANKCTAQNTGCGMGGSLAHHGPLSIQRGQGQRGARVGLHPEAPWGSCHRRQRAHAHQVVYRYGEGEHPPDSYHPEMPGLAQQVDGFQPPKALFHALATSLTHGVPRRRRHATIGRARAARHVLCHMGCRPQLAELSDAKSRVL
jgi:hypothetical protein